MRKNLMPEDTNGFGAGNHPEVIKTPDEVNLYWPQLCGSH